MRWSLAAILLASVSTHALADDNYIKHATCSPYTRTYVAGIINEVLVITLPSDERSSYRVVQTARFKDDNKDHPAWQEASDIKSVAVGQNVPLWPAQLGVTYMSIITALHDGNDQKICALKLETFPTAEAAAADGKTVTLNLMFDKYSDDKPIAPTTTTSVASKPAPAYDPIKAAQWISNKKKVETEALKAKADDAFNEKPCQYQAHGKRSTSIVPLCPMTNGQWVIMRFPGLSRVPAAWIAEDTKDDKADRLARQHQDGDFLVIEEIAPVYKLILGDEIIQIIDKDFSSVGKPVNPNASRKLVVQATK